MKKALGYVSALLLFGCAQQVAPTGGPKDETPPKILSEVPKNLSTEFSSKEIVISFDEFIQLSSPSEQVVISPPLMLQPTYRLTKKSLVVKFTQPLAANTTYTINFGEAIRDNNEGNILTNYTYVFSTGTHLDSMQVKGKLIDVITGEPEPGALVMLYKSDIDSLPLDTIPDYFTRTTSDGAFHIKHVADQPYKIFALKDENANYRFDVPGERIGFLDTLIVPFTPPVSARRDTTASDSTAAAIVDTMATDSLNTFKKQGGASIPNYLIQMFAEEDTTQFLKKAYCEHHGKLVFVYNRPVRRLEVEMQGASAKKQWMLRDYSAERDTVTVWATDVTSDTLDLILSVGRSLRDTVELMMKERADEVEAASAPGGRGKKRKMEKFGLTGKTNPAGNHSPKPGDPLTLIWNHPVIGTDLSKVRLYEDSVRVEFDIVPGDSALRKFDIFYPWKKGLHYRLSILDSAFTDIFKLWNDTLETTFKGTDREMLGDLSLKITEAPAQQVVVELLNSAKKPIGQRAVSGTGTVLFERLDPGKYTIQVVSDLNGNGKWDSGRYSEKRQPEPVRTVQQGIEVRANWNMELEWNPNTAD